MKKIDTRQLGDIPECRYVEWIDHSTAHGWNDAGANFQPINVRSIGWVVGEDDEIIKLTPNWTAHDDFSEVLCILKSCIVKDEIIQWVGK